MYLTFFNRNSMNYTHLSRYVRFRSPYGQINYVLVSLPPLPCPALFFGYGYKKSSRLDVENFIFSLSGRRGSNSRPSAWKADALSTELLPQFKWAGTDSNRRRRKPTDLQSARFNHLPTYPCVNAVQRYEYFLNLQMF